METHLRYRDASGAGPVVSYIDGLDQLATTSKLHRTQLERILRFWGYLEAQGAWIGDPYVDHLGDGIWELRPYPHRILFIVWRGRTLLLHAFHKKSGKVPPRDHDVARRRRDDWISRHGG